MIHHVFANKSNIGDWLSARGIQSLLPGLELQEHLCDRPFVDQTLKSLASASSSDLIIIGGGGLFMDYFTPFWEGFRQIGARVPFVIWGVGYCDLKCERTRPPQALLEEIVFLSQLCVVRDELSRGRLSACSIPDPVPCPSVAAVPRACAQRRGVLHVDNYTTAGGEVFQVMDAYGRDFARRTQRPFLQTNNHIPAGRADDLAAILGRYAKADIVLSSALHGCIVGLAMGCNVIAVSGDYKIESFMEAANLHDWVCDLGEVGKLPNLLECATDQDSADHFIQKVREANARVAARVLAMIGNHRQLRGCR